MLELNLQTNVIILKINIDKNKKRKQHTLYITETCCYCVMVSDTGLTSITFNNMQQGLQAESEVYL